MKATFALLADSTLHNRMRRMAYELNRDHGVGFFGAQLPPHISLKQPFRVTDTNAIEAYFDAFAAETAPVGIEVRGMYTYPMDKPTGFFMDIVETPELRALHNRLNRELKERFGDTDALFDGDGYHFHATVALGEANSDDSYKRFLSGADLGFTYSFTAREIVMFYYADDAYGMGTFMTYKVLPLLGQGR